MSNNITFVIFVFNEERRIEYILRAFQGFGNILIIDNYSTDNTVKIAEKYTKNIYQYKNPGWVENKEVMDFVFDKVETDWVYIGYADEIPSKKLLNKLSELSDQDQYKVAYLGRRNHHYGLKDLYLENGISPRFFKLGAIDFAENQIHGFGKIMVSENEVIHLPTDDSWSIHHFSTYDISKFINNHNRYADIEAEQKYENNINFSPLRLFMVPIYTFFRYYFLHGGWKSGWRGFMMTMEYCFFFFNIEAKLWELQNDINLESIEKKYDDIKEEMLEENLYEK